MTLDEVAAEYCVIRPMSRGAQYLLSRSVVLLGAFLGRRAVVSDLTDETVSAWLQSLEPRYSQWTVAGHRLRILALWRFTSRRQGISGPGEVRRERPPEPMPSAWSEDEVARLVRAAASLPEGWEYFRALVLAAWETGLRRSDLQSLQRDWISVNGVVTIRQRKSGYPHYPQMRKSTVRLVLALPGQTPLASPWGTRKYCRLWARLKQLAGVSGDGCLQQLRRSGATAVAAKYGLDAAREYLGHRSPEMVRHYVDISRLPKRSPIPPKIS